MAYLTEERIERVLHVMRLDHEAFPNEDFPSTFWSLIHDTGIEAVMLKEVIDHLVEEGKVLRGGEGFRSFGLEVD